MTQIGFTVADVARLRALFNAVGQGHVFTFWESLTTEQQQNLCSQLADLDIFRVNQIYNMAVKSAADSIFTQAASVYPLPAVVCDSVLAADSSIIQEWRELGLKLIAEGKVAVILMAGCKGTGLGSSGPKGCYDIDSPSGKVLFQLQAERIIELQELARTSRQNVYITWYILTSSRTHGSIYSFFEDNNFFGLEKENVLFFEQGILPCLTMEGKILMENKYKVAVAPDSNGGIYHALYNKGVIDSLKERGILYSHCYDVDNCFTKVADPIFIGYSVTKNVDCSVKVFAKALPEEHVGVAECSQMPKEVFGMRKSDGSLNVGAANIVSYIFSTEYLDHILTFAEILEYHVTRKKIKHIDLESGELIVPKADTGIVLECSIFDVFPFPRKLSVLEVDCKEEFSSLKNILERPTQGSGTPRQDLLAQRLRAFHASSGKDVAKDSNETLEVKVTSLVSIWW